MAIPAPRRRRPRPSLSDPKRPVRERGSKNRQAERLCYIFAFSTLGGEVAVNCAPAKTAAGDTLHLRKWKRLAASLIIGTMCLNTSARAGGEDRRYETVRLALSHELATVLTTANLCSSVSLCSREQIIFASPQNGGVAIQVWGVNNETVAQQLVATCASAFLRHSELDVVTVDLYPVRKIEAVNSPIWKSVKPSQRVSFMRGH